MGAPAIATLPLAFAYLGFWIGLIVSWNQKKKQQWFEFGRPVGGFGWWNLVQVCVFFFEGMKWVICCFFVVVWNFYWGYLEWLRLYNLKWNQKSKKKSTLIGGNFTWPLEHAPRYPKIQICERISFMNKCLRVCFGMFQWYVGVFLEEINVFLMIWGFSRCWYWATLEHIWRTCCLWYPSEEKCQDKVILEFCHVFDLLGECQIKEMVG